MIKGIDVSNWQGQIQWQQVAAQGIGFAFVKVTEGTGYTDPYGKANVSGARAQGLKVGVYHFLRPGQGKALAEAEHFVQHTRDLAADWLVVDIETTDEVAPNQVKAYTRTWLKRVQELTGKTPLVYTYVSFANRVLGDSLVDWPLWVAHYGVKEPGQTPWPQWVCWQHSDAGTVPGIGGKVDMNWMKEEFFMSPEPQVEPWKQEIMDQALKAGLIKEPHNPNDPAPQWFVLAVALNLLEISKSKE